MNDKRHKIIFSFGTRPEAIKLAPVIMAMKSLESLEVILAVSGQHNELLYDALDVFGLKPDYDLGLMHKVKGLAELTAAMITGYAILYNEVKPDMVVVHGDTSTTFAAALAAYYEQLPIAHVEAGLRTYHKYKSFPEELNRRLVAGFSDLHFAPSESARQNLLSEHVPDQAIEVTGNTVIDALRWVLEHKQDPFGANHYLAPVVSRPFILVTAHRRESWGKQHREFFKALQSIAEQRPEISVLFPVHPNPLLREETKQWLQAPSIHLIEPQDYYHFAFLMHRAILIVTDSGSIQEEVTYLGKPAMVIRDATERVDAMNAGNVKLIGLGMDNIRNQILYVLDHHQHLQQMSQVSSVYGDGTSAQQIARRIQLWLHSL